MFALDQQCQDVLVWLARTVRRTLFGRGKRCWGKVRITFVWSLDSRWTCYGTIFFMTLQITTTRMRSSFTATEYSVTACISGACLMRFLVRILSKCYISLCVYCTPTLATIRYNTCYPHHHGSNLTGLRADRE